MGGDETPLNAPALWQSARARWPAIELPMEAFTEALDQLGDERMAVGDDEAAELYLACACARGDRHALATFEQEYVAAIPAALSRMRLSPADLDEVVQGLRQRLLVGDGGAPRLLGYAGRGTLRGLVRVAATRLALDLLRRRGRDLLDPDEDLLRHPDGSDDPELAAIKQQHRAEFRCAFEEAVALLSKRQRTIMRLHYLDGVTLHSLATMYSVNRATVVRWLAAAREQLMKSTRRALAERLHMGPEDLSSLVRVVESRFEVSLRRLLASGESGDS